MFGQTRFSAPILTACSVFAISMTAGVAHAKQPFLIPNSLVISSSTYDRTQGVVASLAVGTTLPDTATSTTTAVSNGNYVSVWNNEKGDASTHVDGDASFGVTSPIQLTVIEPHSGHVFASLAVPTDQVVTSFPSKSEVGLHVSKDRLGFHLIFVGYGGAGVGALDVSNSDAVAGQDPTNPVTFAFGSTFAFPRTIVSVDAQGHFAYTPTSNYGGNNGRSALLGSNGLYYMAGNANNGNAATFGFPFPSSSYSTNCPSGPSATTATLNCTIPDVTETTGIEAVNPIDAVMSNAAIPAGNSAEVNPLIQDKFGTKVDKSGKDNNYRGVTEFGGALYFTKGSGSNGIDTVYTVASLPTVAGAATATISVVPGFPMDSAKASGGNYTPFAVFFADASTMYVTDEGSGNSTDATTHAGLEKWSLVSGTWILDYVLTNGLIGAVDNNLTGNDGPWPDVTTVGLRNLTGFINDDGTVTLYATTSTASTSGDNGADPNKVVAITDVIAAKTLTGPVAQESFSTIAGPTYGTVYRGVAIVQ